jgi:hypothetical protein
MAKTKFVVAGKSFKTREAYQQALEEGPPVKRQRKAPTTPRARKAKTPAPATACGLLSRGLRASCGKNANAPISDARVRAVKMFATTIAGLPMEELPSVFSAMDTSQPQAAPVGVVEDVAMRAEPPKTGNQVRAPGESTVTAVATNASEDPPVVINQLIGRKRQIPMPSEADKQARIRQLEAAPQYKLKKTADGAMVGAKQRRKTAEELTRLTYVGGGQFKGTFLKDLEAKYSKKKDTSTRILDVDKARAFAERLRRMRDMS